MQKSTQDAKAFENQRRDVRHPTNATLKTVAIDPSRDPVRGTPYYESDNPGQLLNLSRRGICARVQRPPTVSQRVLVELFLPNEERSIELIGRTCWGRVEFERGQIGARALAMIGIEVIGGSAQNIARYDAIVSTLEDATERSLAAERALG